MREKKGKTRCRGPLSCSRGPKCFEGGKVPLISRKGEERKTTTSYEGKGGGEEEGPIIVLSRKRGEKAAKETRPKVPTEVLSSGKKRGKQPTVKSRTRKEDSDRCSPGEKRGDRPRATISREKQS